jgi:hypothetical protein
MSTLKVIISDADRKAYGLGTDEIDFEELRSILTSNKASLFLHQAARFAENSDMPPMSEEEIDQLIAETRRERAAPANNKSFNGLMSKINSEFTSIFSIK